MKNLKAVLMRQIAWSRSIFGPGTRTVGIIRHLRKEIAEIETAKTHEDRKIEWADVTMLALDGFWREIAYGLDADITKFDMMLVIDELLTYWREKQGINEQREWPDYRTLPADQPSEHIGADKNLPTLNYDKFWKNFSKMPSLDARSITDVLVERARQVDMEGWTPEHDDRHQKGELAQAACCYAMNQTTFFGWHFWPWAMNWWKPTTQRRNLVKAAALMLAEIDRLDRLAQAERDAADKIHAQVQS